MSVLYERYKDSREPIEWPDKIAEALIEDEDFQLSNP